MALTVGQESAKEEILNLFRNGEKRVKLLGSAGTGKTYLADEIVKAMRRDYGINKLYNNGIVYVTTPTNKALAVIKGKVTSPVAFATIHSALKLRGFTDSKTGRETFVKAWSKDDNFKNCKAAIIDECSMLGVELEGGMVREFNPDTEVFEERYQAGHLDGIGFPILYLGDEKQLNPVGEEVSAVFAKDYPAVRLTEIVRQGAGNPIIDLSQDIDLIHFKTPNLINGKGYVYDNDKSGILETLAEVNGTDEYKYLAYINTNVDSMNKAVRQRIYGDSPNKVEMKEMLVINKPIAGLYTNQEVKVESLSVITSDVQVPNAKTKFDSSNVPINNTDKVRLKFYRVNDTFNVIHEDSTEIYNKLFDMLVYNCGKRGWDFKGKSFFRDLFADIKYNHAITVHKSQGSTYKTVVIDIANIMLNKRALERDKMLYTAITRASDLVILNNVR